MGGDGDDAVSVQTSKEDGATLLRLSSDGHGLKAGKAYRAVPHGEEGLTVLSTATEAFVAGSLTALSLADVFAHILAGIRTGRLCVTRDREQRVVAFREGQIVFASSTEKHERLGSVLLRLGLVSREQLDAALLQVGSKIRLGQVLTQQGVVSSANLYSAMTFMVREIAVNLFELAEGEFLFVEDEPGADALKLPERTKALVLEGMKRGEEAQRLRRHYPEHFRVRRGPHALAAPSAVPSSLFDKGATIGELRSRFEGGQHAFYTWVEEQLRTGAWAPEAAATPTTEAEAGDGRSALELYTQLISAIVRAIRDGGHSIAMLTSFDEQHAPGLAQAFHGVEWSQEGGFNVERLRANVSEGDAVQDRIRMYAALDAFVAYALFAARNVLPAELAEALEEEARQMREEH
ncbi:MAG: DUF4388 domain-containing protein [Myxococcaceae bacterium]